MDRSLFHASSGYTLLAGASAGISCSLRGNAALGKTFIICFLLLDIAASSFADEIWRWTDKNNVVHFTDNRLSIPQAFRETARSQDLSSREGLTGSVKHKSPLSSSVRGKKEDPSKITDMLAELSAILKYEIERDSKIVTWVNNSIAIKKMKELFSRDLVTKRKLLQRMTTEDNRDMANEVEWLTDNISTEERILGSVRNPDPGTVYLFTGIKESIKNNLSVKRDFLLNINMQAP